MSKRVDMFEYLKAIYPEQYVKVPWWQLVVWRLRFWWAWRRIDRAQRRMGRVRK